MNPIPVAKVFIVIPAYNEAQVLGATLQTLLHTQYSIVVIDDGSKDETWKMICKYPVFGLRHAVNLGQGAALQTGMTFALRMDADIIVHFDADGQHSPDDLERMLSPIMNNEADVVLGSRFLRPDDIHDVPFLRRVLLKSGVYLNGVLTGLWLSDAHNGYRVLNRKAAQKIKLHENGFAHASEILIQIKSAKLRYIEKPVNIKYTDYSMQKGQSIWNGINILVDLILRRFYQ